MICASRPLDFTDLPSDFVILLLGKSDLNELAGGPMGHYLGIKFRILVFHEAEDGLCRDALR